MQPMSPFYYFTRGWLTAMARLYQEARHMPFPMPSLSDSSKFPV